MPDAGTVITAVVAVSTAYSLVALGRAGKATVELVRAGKDPLLGGSLEAAYASVVAEDVPAELTDLLESLE